MNPQIADFCQAGLSLVPIPPISGLPVKGPRATGWNRPKSAKNPHGYSTNAADFANHQDFNFGLYHAASKTLAFDIDDVAQSFKVFDEAAATTLQDWLDDPQRAEIKSPKANRGKLLFKLPDDFTAVGLKQFKHNGKTIFELRSGNCQDVAIGRHPEGGAYKFVGDPSAIPPAPAVLLDMLQHWDAWKPCLDSALAVEQPPPKIAPQRALAAVVNEGQRDPIQAFNQAFGVAEVLSRNGYVAKGKDNFLRPDSTSKAPGAHIMRNCSDGVERVFSHGGDVLNDSFAHDAFDCYRLLECDGDLSKALNWNAEITHHNQRLYMRNHSLDKSAGSFDAPAIAGTDVRDGTSSTRPLTELGNAYRLFDGHSESLRFVHNAKAWLHWRDGAWVWDVDGAITRSLAAELHKVIYAEGTLHLAECEFFAKWARNSQKENTIESAVSLLEDFEAVRIPMSLVDTDPFLVGLDNARTVLDLRTGATRSASPKEYITKSLNIDQLGDSNQAKRWQAFLAQVFGDDKELIDWLQRWLGYMLTGSTAEQCFVFCYGLGSNGKGVMAETIKFIMGDYSRAIASETLTEAKRQAGAATPDLADLIGCRMALSTETEDGQALAESLVKSLVSGDSMTARKLYGSPIQFTPQFKLMMLGNHKPIIRGNDYGIWRRVRLIPFTRTFEEQDRDPALLTKLRAEAPHILHWMLEGCLNWQIRGLSDIPACIKQATGDYQKEQDIIGQWISESCTLAPAHEAPSTELYSSYRSWCLEVGIRPASKISFGRRLSERGLLTRKSHGNSLWLGISVLTDTSFDAA